MTRKTPPTNCRGYHHGDLRNSLIIAAGQLIQESGYQDFSMIDASRRAGVSSAAPYRHFKDKDALLEAVTQVAFLALTESARNTDAMYVPGSTQSLIAQGKAYIKFVIDHPQFYDLMWGDIGLRSTITEVADLKTSGFYVLMDSVSHWCQNNLPENPDALDLSVKLWAMAHGLACLNMNQQIEKFLPDADVYVMFEASAHTFLDGLRGMTKDKH